MVWCVLGALMDWLENSLQILGIAMCVVALLPLALWTVQSFSTLRQNRVHFQESQELLRQQILDANTRRTRLLAQNSNAPSDVQLVKNETSVVSHLLTDVVQIGDRLKSNCETIVAADGSWKGFRKFVVERLEKETAICTSVYLQPVDGDAIADFQAGQHLSLRFNIPGQPKPVVRCYSLSDGPGKMHYRISVKTMLPTAERQTLGLVSNYINNQLKVGDVVESRAPSGSFYIDLSDQRPVVMLAGGIGITPMISMIEALRRHAPNRVGILLYGVRNKADQAFHDYLNKVAVEHKNLHLISCFSDPEDTDLQGKDYQLHGFVTIDLIRKLIPNSACQFYLCGPPAFMSSLRDGLEAWGVAAEQVFLEAFGPASIKENALTNPVLATDDTIEVAFEQSGKTVAWQPSCQSLLELAESNGIEIDFGCRAGSCGTCATELLEGEVEYPDSQHINCEPGECLTCVARPQGSIKLGV